jgi:antitoxin ParD1/3/4
MELYTGGPMVQQFSITVPEPMAQEIQGRVERGDYASASEVIREALRLWLQREKRLAVLDEAIARGIADLDAGRLLDIERVRKDLRKEPA